MNTAVEVNPMLRLVNDQFDDVFGESVSPQMATAVAMTDAFFGGVAKVRKPTLDDRLSEAIVLSRKIATLCRELKQIVPSDFDSELEESKGFAEDILTNIAAIRMHLAEPYEPCDCGGKCDSCVAARSDEHQDRVRDGHLCDEA